MLNKFNRSIYILKIYFIKIQCLKNGQEIVGIFSETNY